MYVYGLWSGIAFSVRVFRTSGNKGPNKDNFRSSRELNFIMFSKPTKLQAMGPCLVLVQLSADIFICFPLILTHFFPV